MSYGFNVSRYLLSRHCVCEQFILVLVQCLQLVQLKIGRLGLVGVWRIC